MRLSAQLSVIYPGYYYPCIVVGSRVKQGVMVVDVISTHIIANNSKILRADMASIENNIAMFFNIIITNV